MTERKKRNRKSRAAEQGFAMIVAMMALSLLTALGLAVMFSSSGDIVISGHFRRNEQAFFAAEAGVGLARNAIRQSLNQAILTNATAAQDGIDFPAAGQAFDDSQLTSLLTNPGLTAADGAPITNALAAIQARSASLGGSGNFNVTLTLEPVGSPVLGTRPAAISGIQQPPSTITMQYRYTINSTGRNISADNPFTATAQAQEQGVVNVTLNTNVVDNSSSSSTISRSFSSYGTFLNRFTQTSVWAAGTFSGPVHTNDRFRYSAGNPVTYRDAVTQVGTTYDYRNSSGKWYTYNVSNTNRTGLTFQSTYTRVDPLPLPQNVYKQELAVLNSTGQTDATFTSAQPTTTQLTANLRQANNSAAGTTSGTLNEGVYVPSSDGSTITGGGIYVKGNADEITLSVSGSSQVYAIRQGSTTTTITITPPSGTSAGSTTISNGTSSTTYSGVPMDKTIPSNQKPGVSLFVSGNINSLHGPAAASNVTPAAIASKTAATITSTGDIVVTGSLKYQDTVLNLDGTQTSNGLSATNVLGLFTNSGRIEWNPSSTYTDNGNRSMVVDVAMTAFNEAALNADSSAQTGGWITNCSHCSSSSTFTLRGSRVASRGLPFNSSGIVNRFFDPRFANGAFAPPFFPVTELANTVTATATFAINFTTSNVATESNTWQRISN